MCINMEKRTALNTLIDSGSCSFCDKTHSNFVYHVQLCVFYNFHVKNCHLLKKMLHVYSYKPFRNSGCIAYILALLSDHLVHSLLVFTVVWFDFRDPKLDLSGKDQWLANTIVCSDFFPSVVHVFWWFMFDAYTIAAAFKVDLYKQGSLLLRWAVLHRDHH